MKRHLGQGTAVYTRGGLIANVTVVNEVLRDVTRPDDFISHLKAWEADRVVRIVCSLTELKIRTQRCKVF